MGYAELSMISVCALANYVRTLQNSGRRIIIAEKMETERARLDRVLTRLVNLRQGVIHTFVVHNINT